MTIRELIAKGRVAEAIELLPDEWPVIIGQRWSQFERNKRMGLLSYDQESLDRNRIINSIFEITKGDKLDELNIKEVNSKLEDILAKNKL